MSNGFDDLLRNFEHNILNEKCSAFVKTKRGKVYKGYVQGNKFHYEQNGQQKSVKLSVVSDALVIESKQENWTECPDCKDSSSWFDGADDNDEICYNCGGAGQVPVSQIAKEFGEGAELFVDSLELNEALTANALKSKLRRLLTLTGANTASLKAYDYFTKQGSNMPLVDAAEAVGVSKKYMKKILQKREDDKDAERKAKMKPLSGNNFADVYAAYMNYKEQLGTNQAIVKAAEENNVDPQQAVDVIRQQVRGLNPQQMRNLEKKVRDKVQIKKDTAERLKASENVDQELEEVKKKYNQSKVGAGGIQATMKDKPSSYLKGDKLVGG